VCQIWGKELAIKLPDVSVQVRRSKIKDADLPTLSTFLATNNISHALKLNFFDFSLCHEDLRSVYKSLDWKPRPYREHRHLLIAKFYAQSNKLTPDIEKYLLNTSHLIVDLRLEIHLVRKGDAALFAGVVSKLVNLRKLALDITDVKKEEVLLVPLDCIPTSVRTAGLRVHEARRVTNL
jgi:hypothetical protein